MIRRGTNNKITSRHGVVVEISDVRRRVGRQKPGARPGLGDSRQVLSWWETGRPGPGPGDHREREISAVRTGVWATHNAACLHCRHCSDDNMETWGLTLHWQPADSYSERSSDEKVLTISCIPPLAAPDISGVLSDIANCNWVRRVITDWSHSRYLGAKWVASVQQETPNKSSGSNYPH